MESGRHHRWLNLAWPINFDEQLVFNDLHRHFGKGQTGAVWVRPPGEQRVHLLFADQVHRPMLQTRSLLAGPLRFWAAPCLTARSLR